MTRKTLINGSSLHVVACETVARELRGMEEIPEANITVLRFGLHTDPQALKVELQQTLDAIEGEGDVLLGYGLCSEGVVGVVSRCRRMVIPKVDDCIALFLGSREAYAAELAQEAGTYFLTKGWVEATDFEPFFDYRRLADRYGEERALQWARRMLVNYTRLMFIDTDNRDIERYRDYCIRVAGQFDLRYAEKQGSRRLLKKLFDGEWDDEFIVIPPGEMLGREHFMSNLSSRRRDADGTPEHSAPRL